MGCSLLTKWQFIVLTKLSGIFSKWNRSWFLSLPDNIGPERSFCGWVGWYGGVKGQGNLESMFNSTSQPTFHKLGLLRKGLLGSLGKETLIYVYNVYMGFHMFTYPVHLFPGAPVADHPVCLLTYMLLIPCWDWCLFPFLLLFSYFAC